LKSAISAITHPLPYYQKDACCQQCCSPHTAKACKNLLKKAHLRKATRNLK
jgi:hypothetical protein